MAWQPAPCPARLAARSRRQGLRRGLGELDELHEQVRLGQGEERVDQGKVRLVVVEGLRGAGVGREALLAGQLGEAVVGQFHVLVAVDLEDVAAGLVDGEAAGLFC